MLLADCRDAGMLGCRDAGMPRRWRGDVSSVAVDRIWTDTNKYLSFLEVFNSGLLICSISPPGRGGKDASV